MPRFQTLPCCRAPPTPPKPTFYHRAHIGPAITTRMGDGLGDDGDAPMATTLNLPLGWLPLRLGPESRA
ncbi:unnamed protein product [Aspergillus oryzae]|nr:unnamed protein product [Aspergillus oryzae]